MLVSHNGGFDLHVETSTLETDPNSVLVKFYTLSENPKDLSEKRQKFTCILTKKELSQLAENLSKNS